MKIKDEKTGKTKDVRLPKKFKKDWIKALRSGEYEQGKMFLNNHGSYCCLGVACRIQHPKLNLGRIQLIAEGDKAFTKKRLKGINVPDLIKGIPEDNGIVNKLVTMNDNGKSFKQIAIWLDTNL